MVNLSLQTGHFDETWNPSLKKPGLDLLFKSFRLTSNLQFVFKLTERVLASQISDPPCRLGILLKPGKLLWYTIIKKALPRSTVQEFSSNKQLAVCDMITNNLFPQLQSAYRSHHSPETALFKVTNDLLMNVDKDNISLLLLLDLSAAFDTVEHGILLQSLQMILGVCGTALSWFKSYLEGRS